MKPQQSVDRRKFVGGIGVGAFAAAAGFNLTEAAPGTQSGPEVARAQGSANIPTPRNETLIIERGVTNVWDSFNAFIPNGQAYDYGLEQICREAHFYANFLTGEIRPWLATKYAYNADFTECTLTLRPDAKWNDGTPYTSADIVFTQELLLKNEALNGAAGVIRDVKAVTAPDPQTVVWTLTKANPRFHYRFVAGIIQDGLKVVAKHEWEGKDPGTYKANPPIQTGPYVLQEASASKLYYLWKKNPDYWNSAELDCKPNYIIVVQATSQDTSVQDFIAGNVDVSGLDFLNQEVAVSQFETNARFNFPDPCPRGFFFNVDSPSGLFATPEGRWAISHLIDREVIANTIWQPSSRAATMPWADYAAWVPWATPAVLEKYDLSYNVDIANQMLDALGATERDGDVRILNGKPLRLTAITPALTTGLEYQIGVNLQTTAKAAGIEIEIKSLPGSAFGDAYNTGQYDLSCHWVCGMQFDPNQLYGGFHSRTYMPIGERTNQGDQSAARLRVPEFDAVIDKLDNIDPEAASSKPTFDQALDIFMTQLPCVPSIQTIYPFLYSTQYWTGWPSEDNPYTIPASWWGQFMFAIGTLTPTGQ